MASNWSKTYWADLGERVLSTEIGALLTTSLLMGGTALDWSNGEAVWTLLGAPPAVSFLKGILANLKDSDSGPSLLPSPPAPDVNDEAGAVGLIGVVVIVLVVLAILALFGVF
jgi:hypothetical protein